MLEGHNSGVTSEDREKLTAYFERYTAFVSNRKEVQRDITELFQEMKSSGFDTKAARKVFSAKIKKEEDAKKYQAERDMEDFYSFALGLD